MCINNFYKPFSPFPLAPPTGKVWNHLRLNLQFNFYLYFIFKQKSEITTIPNVFLFDKNKEWNENNICLKKWHDNNFK